MKNILVISELHIIRTFILPTFFKLKECSDVQFDCFIVTKIKQSDIIELGSVFTNIYCNKFPSGIVSRIPRLRFIQYIFGLRKVAKELSDYDFAHINFLHYYYAFFTPIIRKRVERLYITFYGSDFNNIKWYHHVGNKRSVAISDRIFVTQNPELLNQIIKKYRIENANRETGILFPLVSSFESFQNYCSISTNDTAKEALKINSKYLMVCGNNASPIVQHEKIIEVLTRIQDCLTSFTIIFPMSYGQQAKITRSNAKALLSTTTLEYSVIEEFLEDEEVLALRLACDIYIHIQTRDQMSFSMLQHLAAGGVVITGRWLPYESLVALGVYFIQIDKVEDLEKTILEVLDSLEKHLYLCKKNRDIILNLTSWEKNKTSWYDTYDLVLK